ncbi:MAG TPA: S8 family peptidase [Solirubrobacteraceae bacterium]|jgi:subtilisin family serine protease|nr:S8 family peptidase [Solirubrobacteraceae bacterium]
MSITGGARDRSVSHHAVAALGVLIAATGLAVFATSASAADAALVDAGKPGAIAGRYIVVMKDGAGAASADRLEDVARAGGGKVMDQYRHALTGFAGRLSSAALAQVRADGDVAYVEPDAVVRAAGSETIPPPELVGAQPGDLWNLDRIDQRDLPLDNAYTYATTGAGVTAYVIDTGIRATHEDLTGRVTSGKNFVIDGTDTTDAETDDCDGHGTNVAATLGGTVFGVAKNVSLVAVRVLGCTGESTDSTVIAGVDWVTQHHTAGTPAVANMSLGGPGTSAPLDLAVENSIASGITYVVAAGNHKSGEDSNACDGSPADVPAALTVGASTITDTLASFSDTGSCVDLFAPGEGVVSAYINCAPTDTACTPDTSVAIGDGTSMAAPHVAGVAAQYLEAVPTATPATVTSAILNGATPNKIDAGADTTNRLLYSVLDTTTPPPTTLPPTTPSTPGTGNPGSLTIFAPGSSSSATSSSTSSSTSGGGGTTTSRSSSSTHLQAAATSRIKSVSARRVSGRVVVRMKVAKGASTRLEFLSHRASGVLAHRTLKATGATQVTRATVSRFAHYVRAVVTMPGAATQRKIVTVSTH